MEYGNVKLNPDAQPYKVEERNEKFIPPKSSYKKNKYIDIMNRMNKQQQQIPSQFITQYIPQGYEESSGEYSNTAYTNAAYTDNVNAAYTGNENDYNHPDNLPQLPPPYCYHPENLNELPPPDYYQTMGMGYMYQPPNHPSSSNYPLTNIIPKKPHARSTADVNYNGSSSYQFNSCFPTPYYPPGVMPTYPIQTDPNNPQQLPPNYYQAAPIPTTYTPYHPAPSPSPPPPPPISTDKVESNRKLILSNNDDNSDDDDDDDDDNNTHPIPPIVKCINIINPSTSSTDSLDINNNNNNTKDNANNGNNNSNNFSSSNTKYANNANTEELDNNNNSIESSNENQNIESNNRNSNIECKNESSGNIISVSSNDITSSEKKVIELMTPIPEDDECYLIQVDRINPQTTEKKISDIFSLVGNMKYVKIIEKPKRYALVEYSTEDSAINAIKKFNGLKFNGDKILVYWSKEKPEKNKIILENLPYNIDKERIYNICSIVGDIESISIEYPINPNDRSRCEVIFKDKYSVEKSESILNDCEIDGIRYKLIPDIHDTIKLNISTKPKNDKKPSSAPPILASTYQSQYNQSKEKERPIYSTPNAIINSNPIYKTERPLIIRNFDKEEINTIFQPFQIKSINELECPLSYEVVLMNDEMTNTAFKELNSKNYNQKHIELEWGKEKREKRQLNTVFVGCLSEEVTEEDLRIEFEKIGELDSVKIFRQKVKGKSPDYAYVNYVDPKCIDKAIKELNGKNIKGRYITVQYSKKKNARSS